MPTPHYTSWIVVFACLSCLSVGALLLYLAVRRRPRCTGPAPPTPADRRARALLPLQICSIQAAISPVDGRPRAIANFVRTDMGLYFVGLLVTDLAYSCGFVLEMCVATCSIARPERARTDADVALFLSRPSSIPITTFYSYHGKGCSYQGFAYTLGVRPTRLQLPVRLPNARAHDADLCEGSASATASGTSPSPARRSGSSSCSVRRRPTQSGSSAASSWSSRS